MDKHRSVRIKKNVKFNILKQENITINNITEQRSPTGRPEPKCGPSEASDWTQSIFKLTLRNIYD